MCGGDLIMFLMMVGVLNDKKKEERVRGKCWEDGEREIYTYCEYHDSADFEISMRSMTR